MTLLEDLPGDVLSKIVGHMADDLYWAKFDSHICNEQIAQEREDFMHDIVFPDGVPAHGEFDFWGVMDNPPEDVQALAYQRMEVQEESWARCKKMFDDDLAKDNPHKIPEEARRLMKEMGTDKD